MTWVQQQPMSIFSIFPFSRYFLMFLTLENRLEQQPTSLDCQKASIFKSSAPMSQADLGRSDCNNILCRPLLLLQRDIDCNNRLFQTNFTFGRSPSCSQQRVFRRFTLGFAFSHHESEHFPNESEQYSMRK